MTNLAFCDTETTGLDADRHEVWEVGLVLRGESPGTRSERRWLLPVDEAKGDPFSLEVGGFHARHPHGYDRRINDPNETGWRAHPGDVLCSREDFALDFVQLTARAHLVGAVVSFDAAFLSKLLRSCGYFPRWHYHLVDVEALAAGKLGLPPPWNSEELSRAVGVEPNDYPRHTALGDANWAEAIYFAVMGVSVGAALGGEDG